MSDTQQKRQIVPSIGDVYLMKFEGSGSEQFGWRPGLVFQNNTGNTFSPNVIALPLTSSIKKTKQPTHVLVSASDSGLKMDSMVLCENPEKMSKARLGSYLTTLPEKYMREIAIANLIATGAMGFLSEDDLLDVRNRSAKLNCIAS